MSMYRMLLRYIDTVKSARPRGGSRAGCGPKPQPQHRRADRARVRAVSRIQGRLPRLWRASADARARLGSGGAPRRATNRCQSRSASSSSSASQTRALFRRLDMVRTAGISAPRTTPSTVQGDRLEPALEATSARLHRIGFGPIHDPVIPGVHHRAAESSAACSAGCVMTGTRRPAPQYGFGVEPSRRGPPGNASVSSSST